ncbi:hypothetical protein PoB_001504400 [Plakobranchus ocellatus]|uniref:Uncharacterized protein n=1 Tax=Plakobranchus ocellatus TaxID=259542 RepID=A0AAV3Z3E7_9GAST|nr:hypothetical protein PoB_001504400 [Plakobranchus ocellatus]
MGRGGFLYLSGHKLQCDKRGMKNVQTYLDWHVLVPFEKNHSTVKYPKPPWTFLSHSILLELETAMCDSIQVSSGNLPSSTMPDKIITHFCSYNFDLNIWTLHQELERRTQHIELSYNKSKNNHNPSQHHRLKDKKRPIYSLPKQLELCFINSKVELNLITNIIS